MSIESLRRPPRYATKRNPALKTRGGKIRVLADLIGRPLKPHQQYIADVATELNPPGSRLKWRYQLVIVSLPRQTGKTTLTRPIVLERTLSRPNLQCFMCAQMGKDSTARWNDLVSDFEQSDALGAAAHVLRSKGSERLTWPNRSYVSPFAPGPKCLHGYSPELVLIDEGWAFSADEGADLMKAIRPAQITKTDRQLWIISAAGDDDSEWWNELVKSGRESIDDPRSTTAYFEWSIDPDVDPYNPENWDFHPGLDGLITIEDLKAEAENNTQADFLRGFLNRSTSTSDRKLVLDLDQVEATHALDQQPPAKSSDVIFSYEVAYDRTAATIYAAWKDEANLTQIKTYETRPGVHWVAPFLLEEIRAGRIDPAHQLFADDGGPTRLVTAHLRREGYPVQVLSGREIVDAWARFKELVEVHGLEHDNSEGLLLGIRNASERPMGDSLGLSRRHSFGPIDSLIAAVVAASRADIDRNLVPFG